MSAPTHTENKKGTAASLARALELSLASMAAAYILVLLGCTAAIKYYQQATDPGGLQFEASGDSDTADDLDTDTGILAKGDTQTIPTTTGDADTEKETGNGVAKRPGCGKTPTLENESTISIDSGGMSYGIACARADVLRKDPGESAMWNPKAAWPIFTQF